MSWGHHRIDAEHQCSARGSGSQLCKISHLKRDSLPWQRCSMEQAISIHSSRKSNIYVVSQWEILLRCVDPSKQHQPNDSYLSLFWFRFRSHLLSSNIRKLVSNKKQNFNAKHKEPKFSAMMDSGNPFTFSCSIDELLTNSLTNWRTHWRIDELIDKLTNLLTNWLTDWRNNKLIDELMKIIDELTN